MEVQGSFHRRRRPVEYPQDLSMEVPVAAAALFEYQQDHSVEVPVDTKKIPRQSVGWVLVLPTVSF